MKTLVYLASGAIKKKYYSMPFEAMYFIDYNAGLRKNYPDEPTHIRFIGKDALLSIDRLKRDNVRIDCLVVINEGLFDGGGVYPLFSDFLMGYLYPLLKDQFTLITDLNPYKTTIYKSISRLDWAIEKTCELFPGDKNYINPRIFTTYASENGAFGQVFKIRKVNLQTVFQIKNNQIKVKLIHGSIWSDADDLDYIGIKLSNDGVRLPSRENRNFQTSSEFFSAKTNVHNLNNKSVEEILQDAESIRAEVLGLTTWGAGDYEDVFNLLENHQCTQVKEVRFYHLNKNDFAGIYKSYADQIIAAYPNFFTDIIQSDAYNNQYLSVIKMGYSSLMQKLCAEITQALKADEDFRFSEIKIDSNELRVKSRTNNQFIQGLLQTVMKLNN
ncbi:hypothetical protein [Psychroflexus salis]|uniref:Uncharacterized protein n=1 Tax=Psychroflexus salis TaxID=1526574 RepID=A0A917EAR6_9FLAO|nr:hypothetical protein [Psychroflexus salis]GGE15716.1 hypothetical protein GCM10010831_16280 [Psychroflexus salis]